MGTIDATMFFFHDFDVAVSCFMRATAIHTNRIGSIAFSGYVPNLLTSEALFNIKSIHYLTLCVPNVDTILLDKMVSDKR